MKRKFIGGFAVLAIAAMAAWNVNYGSQTKGMSDVMLANVEALAQEIIVGTPCYYVKYQYCIQFWPEPDYEIWIDWKSI